MKNPWASFTPVNDRLVLEADLDRVLRFNKTANPKHYVHMELRPEPYLGNPEAEIVLLNLNPGYSPEDLSFHQSESYRRTWHKNLCHKKQDFPFYLLDPAHSTAPGAMWWREALDPLRSFGPKVLANHIFCLEYFPYHSRFYKSLGQPPLASQEYNFYLLRECLKRRPLVIILRHETSWLKQVPELRDYQPRFTSNNPRSKVLSEKNFPVGLAEMKRILATRN